MIVLCWQYFKPIHNTCHGQGQPVHHGKVVRFSFNHINAVLVDPPAAERRSRMPLPILATTTFSSQRWGIGLTRLHGISNRRAAAYWKDHGP